MLGMFHESLIEVLGCSTRLGGDTPTRFGERCAWRELLDYWWYICSCSDRQVDHCHGLVGNASRAKDDLSLGIDTVLSAMVLTIGNRSR